MKNNPINSFSSRHQVREKILFHPFRVPFPCTSTQKSLLHLFHWNRSFNAKPGWFQDHLVDHVAFPTAWGSKLPLMQGIAFHESWAVRNGVSFLTSELHYPEGGFVGSTLVAAADGSLEFYFNDTVGSEGELIIADIPIVPSKPLSEPIRELPPETDGLDLFNAELQGDIYTFVILENDEDNITLYTGDTKCNVAYKFTDKCINDLYAVGVFDGLHDSAHDSYLQVPLFSASYFVNFFGFFFAGGCKLSTIHELLSRIFKFALL